jgi:O-antigen ligase
MRNLEFGIIPNSGLQIPNSRSPFVWRSTAVRLLLAAFPLWSIMAVVILHTTWPLKLAVGVTAGVTLVSPFAGLLGLAVLSPIGAATAGAIRMQQYRLAEMLVMAFLAAWLLRAGADRHGPRVPPVMAAAGWLLALVLVTSVGSLTWRMREFPAELADTIARLRGPYFLLVDRIGFIDAARIIEGLGLAAATVHVFRRRPSLAVWLPAALCAGAAIAAVMTFLVTRGTGPAPLLLAYRRLGRPGHIFDVNAAGSYFAMVLALAIGMTVRAGGISRAPWIGLTMVTAVGLWYSQSRSATAAIVIAALAVLVWLVTRHWSARERVAALAIVIALGVGGSFIRARLLERDPEFRGGGFRPQFYATSLRMIAARPLSGVGVGQYARTSALFLSPQLAWSYGSENAHNYFLQIGGELGIPGLAFFAIWVGTGLAVMGRSLERAADPRLLGATAGVVALLMTCATGHPLLVSEVAFPFWIQFGLALGLAVSPLLNAATATATAEDDERSTARRRRLLATATACAAGFVLLAATLGAVARPMPAPASPAVDGLYPWEAGEDGRKVRWTGQYGSVFVPADTKRVYIPIRVPVDTPAIAPMPVDIVISGQRRGRVLVGRNWGTLDLWMPEVVPPSRFNRIDLRIERTWQPALNIAGSYDMRSVGVQIGECELVR